MKIKIFFAILLLATFYSFADEQKHTETMTVEDSQNSENEPTPITIDKEPGFPGGINGLMHFLGENMVYPSACAKKNIQGKVIVKFTIFEDGKVGDIEVEQSVHPLLDAEAIRVVSLLPNFTPGEYEGKPVAITYYLPITFKLKG
ncbi:MAG: energy transducer TonB [Muribaculaceae bacterium]|nr:energy transducer TonB [Muribaculaceae bacterium]